MKLKKKIIDSKISSIACIVTLILLFLFLAHFIYGKISIQKNKINLNKEIKGTRQNEVYMGRHLGIDFRRSETTVELWSV